MKTILVIEDNPSVRDNLIEILEVGNYAVHSAPDGREGVALAQKHIPDLILCDIQMPELNGFEVFYEVNKDPRTAGLPFIFLTANTSLEDRMEGLRMGADDYITKPFEPANLLARIRNRIEKHVRQKKEVADQLEAYIVNLERLLDITSHKVRSPIASILGLLKLLEKSAPTDDQLKMLLYIEQNMEQLDEHCRRVTAYLHQEREDKMKGGVLPED